MDMKVHGVQIRAPEALGLSPSPSECAEGRHCHGAKAHAAHESPRTPTWRAPSPLIHSQARELAGAGGHSVQPQLSLPTAATPAGPGQNHLLTCAEVPGTELSCSSLSH